MCISCTTVGIPALARRSIYESSRRERQVKLTSVVQPRCETNFLRPFHLSIATDCKIYIDLIGRKYSKKIITANGSIDSCNNHPHFDACLAICGLAQYHLSLAFAFSPPGMRTLVWLQSEALHHWLNLYTRKLVSLTPSRNLQTTCIIDDEMSCPVHLNTTHYKI